MTWHRHAKCRGMDIGVFFVDTSSDTQHARAVCATCPVTAECLDEALEQELSGHRFGVRAGMSPKERDQEARRRRWSPAVARPAQLWRAS